MTTRGQPYTYNLDSQTESVWDGVLPTVLAEPITTDITPAASIITDTLVEQVLTAGFLILFWLYVNLVNGFIIFIIRTSNSLRENYQYPVTTCYMMSDMLLCNIHMMMMMIPLVIANDIDRLPHGYCPVVTMLSAGALFANVWMIAYLALERYVYFVRPLKYPRYFSSSNILLANIFMYTIGFSVALIITLTAGRELKASNLVCPASEAHAQKVNIIAFFIFWFPSGCTSIISFILLRLMTSKHTHQFIGQFQISENIPEHNCTPVYAWKKTVKTVAIISGAFWITAMPGALIRIGIKAYDFTNQDIDSRTNVTLFAISRGSYLLMTVLSSILNPIIYMTLQKDLRKAVIKYVKSY